MEQDPLIDFLSSISNKIKIEKEHKELMEKINNSSLPVAEKDPLQAAISVLKQKIIETKNISLPVEENKIESLVPQPMVQEDKDTLGDFVSKLKDILAGKKVEKTPEETAKDEPIVVGDDIIEAIPDNKPDKEEAAIANNENDYVKILDQLSNEVAVEKEPAKVSEIKKLIEQYAEKYFKKAAVMSEYAGGGGTNAVQYANGGVMNGDLNVNGHILSGGRDISNFFGGGGGGRQTLSFNEANADLSISGGNTVSLSALSGGGVGGPADRLVSGSYQVVLSSNGQLNVPGAIVTASNSKLDLVGLGPNIAYLTSTADDTTALYMATDVAELRANTTVSIYTNTGDISRLWTFGTDGSLTFPDNTTQTTAFTGNPDLTPYAKVTDFVHLSGDTMTGNLSSTALIYSRSVLPQLPTPKIVLGLGGSGPMGTAIQYLTGGNVGDSPDGRNVNYGIASDMISIYNEPQLIVKDITEEMLSAYQIFIEMVIFKRRKWYRGMGGSHSTTQGMSFRVPVGNNGQKPWTNNFWTRSGGIGKALAASGIIRYNHLPVLYNTETIDLTPCLNGHFVEKPVAYQDNTSEVRYDLRYLNCIVPFGTRSTGTNGGPGPSKIGNG